MHPDYVSQHAAVGGAAAQVLASFFGTDDFSFRITTSTAPGGVFRSYASFSQAAPHGLSARTKSGQTSGEPRGSSFPTTDQGVKSKVYTGYIPVLAVLGRPHV